MTQENLLNMSFQRNMKKLSYGFSGLQLSLHPGKVPFATGPYIYLSRNMSDNSKFRLKRN